MTLRMSAVRPTRAASARALAVALALGLTPAPAGAQDRAAAIEAFRQMDLARAERLSRQWLESHGEDVEIQRLLGMVRLTSGMELEKQGRPPAEFLAVYEDALDALLRAERLGGERRQPDLNHAVGFIRLAQGRHAEAEDRLTRAIAETPERFVLYRLRGSARLELGRYDEAEADLRRSVELNGDDFASRIFLAQALHRQGRHADARAELESYYARIEAAPPDERHFRILYEIAAYALQTNDNEGAREPLEEACRLRPANPVCRNELGKLYHRLQELDRAVAEFDAVLASEQASADVRREALHYRGLLAHDLGDYERSARLLAESLELSPNRGETLKAYASTLRKLGRRDEARAALERLRQVVEVENEAKRLRARLNSEPRNRDARVELIGVLIELDERAEARQHLELLRRADPDDPALAGLAEKLRTTS